MKEQLIRLCTHVDQLAGLTDSMQKKIELRTYSDTFKGTVYSYYCAEIWVGNSRVFREDVQYLADKKSDNERIEEQVLEKLLQSVFTYGIQTSLLQLKK